MMAPPVAAKKTCVAEYDGAPHPSALLAGARAGGWVGRCRGGVGGLGLGHMGGKGGRGGRLGGRRGAPFSIARRRTPPRCEHLSLELAVLALPPEHPREGRERQSLTKFAERARKLGV